MNRLPFAIAAALLTCGSAATTAEEKRQLDAHEHGHGTLNIAIDEDEVAMELIAPGADIVGFEHEAKSDDQKAAVKQAKETLANAANLFKIPSEAKCKLTSVDVDLEDHEHDGHDDHASHDDHGHDDKDHDKKHNEDAEHSEFHATYKFDCATPAALSPIQTDYFKTFPNAKELKVTIVTSKGQTQVEATGDKPSIEF